ncbi:MAG: WbqC family protein, partial [Siphonobacter aquaeclarae]|nr:WbqC family protein [Siphonobacter aquaeclarae]
MKLAIMQPYLFPYIGYFQLLKTVDKFVLYDDVAFINRGWINRNKVLVNGKEQLFTIPLREASQNKKILEIDIDDTQKWRDKLLKTLQQSYKKAPQYAAVYPVIEEILQTPATRIADLIAVSITLLANYLSISTEIVPSSTIYANQHLKGPERILDICLQEGASEYINPIGGMELYDR